VELTYANRAVNLTVDFRHKQAEQSFPQFKMGDRLIVGTGSKVNTGRPTKVTNTNKLAFSPKYGINKDAAAVTEPTKRIIGDIGFQTVH